jgi:uncharacterized membrane-anchored protein YhcB (DUF1043 family)
MLTFITTPTDLIGQISPVATGLIGDFAPYAALIIGIAIGLWLLRWGIDTIVDIKDRRHLTAHLASLTPEERATAISTARRRHTAEAAEEYEEVLDIESDHF